MKERKEERFVGKKNNTYTCTYVYEDDDTKSSLERIRGEEWRACIDLLALE